MSGAVTGDAMRALEAAAMRDGWTAESLMDLAGKRLALRMMDLFPRPGCVIAYLGKGHNSGDALVALRVLRDAGWRVAARAAFPQTEWSVLGRRKFREAGGIDLLDHPPATADMPGPLVLLDGLLGLGARGAPRGPVAELAEEMNHLRATAGARTVAIDLPTGIDADDGTVFPGAVVADATLTIGVVKRGLLAEEAIHHVGRIALVPVEPLSGMSAGDICLIGPQAFPAYCHPAPFDFHKGMAGRVAILAGSESYTGAAVLAALGALRGGAGLVTLHVFPEIHAIMAAKAPPEIIVRPLHDPMDLCGAPYDAIAVGPGLGEVRGERAESLLALLQAPGQRLVVDADALNLLARECPGALPSADSVWTPHPGEFRRLAPDLSALPRAEAARAFADQAQGVLLLKGARTIVTRRDAPLWHNGTGTPGMATAGQGDVLTGVIAAQLARSTPALEAACMAAWICGRAAERAVSQPGMSEESLTSGDTAAALGGAFTDWREGRG
jgi:NAD(P)H-hydrate epimerase